MRCVCAAYLEAARHHHNTVAGTLQTSRATARSASRRGSGLARSCCLCCLGFLDVLVRFFNEFAYTQARASRRLVFRRCMPGGICLNSFLVPRGAGGDVRQDVHARFA